MTNTIRIKNTNVAGRVPTTSNLQVAELGLNTTDKKLYSSDGTNIFEIGNRINTVFGRVGDITLTDSDIKTALTYTPLPVTSYNSLNTDITSLISGSLFGSLIEGSNSGHFVIGIRGNDDLDGFHIIDKGNATTSLTDPYLNRLFSVSRSLGVNSTLNITAPSFIGSLTGNANTATTLQTARTIALSGAATGTATSFNGSANITIPVTDLNASNLSSGTVPDGRLNSSYTGIISLSANLLTSSSGIKIGGSYYPSYEANIDFSSDPANTWRRLVNVVCSSVLYSTIGFCIEIIDPQGNHAPINTVHTIKKETYYVACVRSEYTILDSPDACYVTGPSNRIRAVKTSIGTYEIQIQNATTHREYKVFIYVYASNGNHIVNYYAGDTASEGISQYNSAVSNSATEVFQNINVVGSITGSITGNASTATTLQTPRTINGTSFNGSTNITTSSWGTSRTITLGQTSISVDGSSNITRTRDQILGTPPTTGAFFSNTPPIVASDGVLEIGRYIDFHSTNTTTADFDVRVDCSAPNAITFYGTASVTLTAGSFAGSGASLTSLNASNLSSGIVPDARISGSYTGLTNLTGSGTATFNKYQATGLSTSWGVTSGVNTGGLNTVMGTSTGATWLLSGTSGGVFRYGIQGLDSGNSLRFYAGANSFYFNNDTLYANAFSGSGASLTSLNASNLSSGTIPDARLSGDYTGISNLAFTAAGTSGLRFWGSDTYKIYMAPQSQSGAGRLDATSDYNIYFRIGGGTNRGFVFQNAATNLAQIEANGNLRLTGTLIMNGQSITNASSFYLSNNNFSITNNGNYTNISLGNTANSEYGVSSIEIPTHTTYGGIYTHHTGVKLASGGMSGWGTAQFQVYTSSDWGTYSAAPCFSVTNGVATVSSGVLNGIYTNYNSQSIELGMNSSVSFIDFHSNGTGVATDFEARIACTGYTGGSGGGNLGIQANNLTFTAVTSSFSGSISATSFSGSGASLTSLNASNLTTGTVPNSVISGAYSGFSNVGLTAGSGNGIQFWGAQDTYKIYMSLSTDATWGGRLDTTSDYNMYFKMGAGTNRGFVFESGTTTVAQVDGSGNFYTTGGYTMSTNPHWAFHKTLGTASGFDRYYFRRSSGPTLTSTLVDLFQIRDDGTTWTASHATIGGNIYLSGALLMDGNNIIDAGGGWHRSYGNTGWYNGTYAGGMYMIDTTWVRTYNSKGLYSSGNLGVAGTITVINGYTPTNGAIRLTPNLHLNAGAENGTYINWDSGGSEATRKMLIVGNGNSAEVMYVRRDGLTSSNIFNTNKLEIAGDTLNRFELGKLIIRGYSPTLYFRDYDHNSAMIHCNSNLLYFLRGGVDTESWSGLYPLTLNLSDGAATFGGNVSCVNLSATKVTANSFYTTGINGAAAIASSSCVNTNAQIELTVPSYSNNTVHISFHKPGVFAANFGLDSDNQFACGGWSSGNGYTGFKAGTITAFGNIHNNGGYVYPGRADSSGASQSSWFLGSHASYGLYTNTGFYVSSHIYTAGAIQTINNITPTNGAIRLTPNLHLNSGGTINSVIVNWDSGGSVATDKMFRVGNGNSDETMYVRRDGFTSIIGTLRFANGGGVPTDGNCGVITWNSINQGQGTVEFVDYCGTGGSTCFAFYRVPNIGKPTTSNIIASINQAGTYNVLSDERVKKDIKDIEYGLNTVLALKPRKYNHYVNNRFNNGKVENGEIFISKIGLIAQEVGLIIPEIVEKPENEKEGFYSLDYTSLIPILIKAVQEQQDQIEVMKDTIKLLMSRINRLENIK